MGRRLREEEVMTIQVLHERGCSNREIARQLGIREGAVRYRLARLERGVSDGRSDKPFRAEGLHAVIAHWLARAGGSDSPAARHAEGNRVRCAHGASASTAHPTWRPVRRRVPSESA